MASDVELVEKGWQPQHRRITDIDAPTTRGIDHIFTKPGPPEVTLVVDSKFGSAGLSRLADGTRQMSDVWIRNRLANAVGFEHAEEIMQNGYSAIVAKVKADGSISFHILDANGNRLGSFDP
jgi:hypothetical protein